MVDEMNRALAGDKPSGFRAARAISSPPRISTRTVDRRTGSIPANGYRDEYKKIWGVK